MFGIMGTDAAFANAAGRAGKGAIEKEYASFKCANADPIVYLMGRGRVRIESIKNGVKQTAEYTISTDTAVFINADAYSQIKLYFYPDPESLFVSAFGVLREGGVLLDSQVIKFNQNNCPIVQVMFCGEDITPDVNISTLPVVSFLESSYSKLTAQEVYTIEFQLSPMEKIDLSEIGKISEVIIDEAYNLRTLTIGAPREELAAVKITGAPRLASSINWGDYPNIVKVETDGCDQINSYDFSENKNLEVVRISSLALDELNLSGCTALTRITYPASDSNVSNAIADAITNADATDGIVRTDSEGAYYSTIADAATAKGWTIEPLPA